MMTALSSDLGRQVANAHTFFNIFSSLAILPFISPFVRLIYTLVPDKNRV
jgi:phosphate:Na+ symporter